MEDKVYCEACAELRHDHPELIANGFNGETHGKNFAEDKGLSEKDDTNDCYDFNLMNDCLIGSMADEAEISGMCGWQDYMKKLVPNLWTMFKAIICAICGIWDNIWEIWENIRQLWNNVKALWDEVRAIWKNIKKLFCIVEFMNAGTEFSFGESSKGESYIVAGKGVSYLNVDDTGLSHDVILEYVAGGLVRLVGSLLFYEDNFTDAKSCYNFDNNGVEPVLSSRRKGNVGWHDSETKPNGNGSELVYELRIKMSEFPQVSEFKEGIVTNAEGGGYHGEVRVFTPGMYAHGQHGRCDDYTGDPADPRNDRGHRVPEGWTYLQLRITWIDKMTANPTQYTPGALLGVRMNPQEIDCD